jgi:hypothetical protein
VKIKLLTLKQFIMPTNFYMYFVAAIIPMLVGALYYSPMITGKGWMKANGFTEESLKEGNMVVIFGVSYLFSVLLAVTVGGIVIHQSGAAQMMIPQMLESGSTAQQTFNELMVTYGDQHRNFGHGVLHGILAGLMFALPVIGINSLFERRGWKYIMIHLGYWLITLALMGGLLCKTLVYAPLS